MKQSNYQRIIAQNFLRNISLDGSHNDTGLRIFKERGLVPRRLTTVNREKITSNEGARLPDKTTAKALPDRISSQKYSDEIQPSRRRIRKKKSIRERLVASTENVNTGFIQKITNILVPDFVTTLEPVESEEHLDNTPNALKGEVRFPNNLRNISTKSERIYLLSPHAKMPVLLYSTVPYDKHQHKREIAEISGRIRSSSGDVPGLKPIDLKDEEISYSHLLVPYGRNQSKKYFSQQSDQAPSSPSIKIPGSKQSFIESSSPPVPKMSEPVTFDFDAFQRACSSYDPSILDDPEFGPGQHRTTLTFSSYITSVVDYVNPSELKKEINEKFRTKFPDLQITFSKFKSIKREMRGIAKETELDHFVLAQAYTYFEKIILKGLVNKPNRKLVAGCCLWLAAKLNDVKGQKLQDLMETIDSTFRLSRKELLLYEVPVVVALEFSLHLPDSEIFPHYQKLLWST